MTVAFSAMAPACGSVASTAIALAKEEGGKHAHVSGMAVREEGRGRLNGATGVW